MSVCLSGICVNYHIFPCIHQKTFGWFFALKVGGRLICGPENLPSAVAAVVSRLSCIDSGQLVSVSALALVSVI